MERESYDKIVSLFPILVDLILDPSKWNEVCDQIAATFDATAFVVFEFDLANHAAPMLHTSRLGRTVGAGDVASLQAGVDGEEAESYRRFASFPAGRFFSEFEIYGLPHDRDLPPNPYRESALKSGGSLSRNVAKLNQVGPWMDVASLHLSKFGADLSPQFRTEMDALVPLLERVVDAARTVRSLTEEYGVLVEVLDLVDFGAAIVDATGRIRLKNDTFCTMADAADGFRIRSDHIIPTFEVDRQPLSHAIEACVEIQAKSESHVLRIARRSADLPYVVRTIPIRPNWGSRPNGNFCLVIVLDPTVGGQLSSDGVTALGLLSPAEVDVCELMVKGLPISGIAEHRGRSPETVKDQAKSVLAKLNCRNRNDLIRLAMATRLPSGSSVHTRPPNPPKGG